jgi:23S rRNA (guanosine2251-2'-O)-methyltransferase
VIHGYHPVREILRSRPQAVEKLLVAARPGKRRSEIEALCRRHRIAVEHVSRERLDQLTQSASHNGFVAVRDEVVRDEAIRDEAVQDGAAGGASRGDPDLLVLLEDVQDPRNLGALLRVCEAAGVGRVMIRDRGSAPLTATVVKASAGAAEWLSVERVVNSANCIATLKDEGYWVYGSDAGGDPPWEIDLTGKVVLCFGGEEAGLRARTRQLCDRLAGLPMRGRVASLNVATASAALLYEALRQRSLAASLASAVPGQ